MSSYLHRAWNCQPKSLAVKVVKNLMMANVAEKKAPKTIVESVFGLQLRSGESVGPQ